MDTRTEQAILSAFDEALKDKTAILITHRVSHLSNFSRILVIDKGALVESGTHEALLQRRGVYFEILEQQKWEENAQLQDINSI